MKIAVISDMHLGFHQKERENEAFEQALEAVKLAVSLKPELVLIAGDIFDLDEPEQKSFIEAFKLFSLFRNEKTVNARITRIDRNNESFEYSYAGIPVIAINGTHEYRGKDFVNAVQLLDAAGFLLHLHAQKAVVKKENECIVIHGLSGIPEKFAVNALKAWNPLPEKNAFNILMLHQSFKEFLPFDDEMIATLSLSDIPEGFDLILNGHFHWNSELKEHGKHLIIPGSTILTQMKKLESEKSKGFLLIETKNKNISFHALPKQRRFYYIELNFEEAKIEQIEAKIKEKISEAITVHSMKSKEKPLIRVKLKGSLTKGVKSQDLNIAEIEKSFSDKAIVLISSRLSDLGFKKKILDLSKLQEERKSVKELGFDILEKNLKETSFSGSFNARDLFELLSANEKEKVERLLLES